MPSFNFFQHWYPLLPIEDIEPQKPTTATLLGISLVIWKSPSSEIHRVFLDRCPHRLAPLSEGRIDEQTGNLMCSYHGWQFDYHQHTQHCSSCRNALKTAEFWQWLLVAYFIATVSVVAVLPDNLRVSWGLWLTISALLSLGIAAVLKFWLMPKFYFVDYVHSER